MASQRPQGIKHAISFAPQKEVKHLQHSNTFSVKQRGAELSRIAQSNAEAEVNADNERVQPRPDFSVRNAPIVVTKRTIGRTPSSENIVRTPSSALMGRTPSSGSFRTASSGSDTGRTSSGFSRRQSFSLERTQTSGSANLVSRQDLDQIRQAMLSLAAKTDSIQLRYQLLETLAQDASVEYRWWPPTAEMKTAVEEGYRSEVNARKADTSGDDAPPLQDVLTVMYREILQIQRSNTEKLHEFYEFAINYEGTDVQINLSHSKDTLAKLQRAWPGGPCNLQDFEAAFMLLPQQPTEAQLRYLFFKLHDRLGDPGAQEFELSHEKFVETYEELLYLQEGLRLTRLQELNRLFKFLDIRNMGYIRLTEIINRFPAEEKDLVSRQIETLLVYFDTDKNGRIDRHEFPNFYEGFLKLQNAYNMNDDRRLEEDWIDQAEGPVNRLLFSDVEFLASQFHAMDVKKKLLISMSSVLFTLEGADGGAPSHVELERLRSRHQKSFSHGLVDLGEFVQIHTDFRDMRRKVAPRKETGDNREGDGSPIARRLQRGDTGMIAITDTHIAGGSKNAFVLRKGGNMEAERPTRIQDALLKRPSERNKTDVSAVVDLLRLSPDLKGVEGAALQKVAQGCGCAFFVAGQELFAEGGPSEKYWLVITGSVIVSVRGTDRETLQITEVRAGQGFGELGLIFDQPRGCAAAAARDGALLATVDKELLFHVGLAQKLQARHFSRLTQRLQVVKQLPFLMGRMDAQALFALSHFLHQRTFLPTAVIYERANDAVEVGGAEDLRAEFLPGHKLLFLVQQGVCEVWAESTVKGGGEVKMSNLVPGSCFGGFSTGRRVTRVTASAASAVQICELRIDDALARIPREALVELLEQQQRQDKFVEWRLAQLQASGGVKSFLKKGGRPLSELQTMLQPVPSGKFADDDADTASEVSSQAGGWVDEHVEKVVEVNNSRTLPVKMKLSSKPEVSARHAPLSDVDVIRPLKSRWPIQDVFLLQREKVNPKSVLQKIRAVEDPAVQHYNHPKGSRPPRARAGRVDWMEQMEYPQPVDIKDPQRPLVKEAQQKLLHAASLYELLIMGGHPVHIDVYANLMQESLLAGGMDDRLDNLFTSIPHSEAMGMFLAARHENEKDRSAAALRKHAASRISFALTPNYFFDILDQIAARLCVAVPEHVKRLANELKEQEQFRPTLTAMIPSGIPRPKTAPLPDKPAHGVSTMLSATSGAHSSLTPYQRPATSLSRPRPSSSFLAAEPLPSPTPISAVAAHYSYLRADRTRSVCRSLGQARLSLRSAGSIRTLQKGLYGTGMDHPTLHVKKGPAHPAAVSAVLSHYPLLAPSRSEHADNPTPAKGRVSLSASPSRPPARPGPLRPNSCPPHKLRQHRGGDDKDVMAAVAEGRDSAAPSRSASSSLQRPASSASACPARKLRAGRTYDGLKLWQSSYEAETLHYDRDDSEGGAESPMIAPVKFSSRANSETGPWAMRADSSAAIPIRVEHEPEVASERR